MDVGSQDKILKRTFGGRVKIGVSVWFIVVSITHFLIALVNILPN